MSYQPPYTITPKITHLVAQISEAIGGYYACLLYTSDAAGGAQRTQSL